MGKHYVVIRGERAGDDGYHQDLDCGPDQAWYDAPLPTCPDCGGDLIWWEAGYVPGTRACAGEPIGGRVTSLLDCRVPQPSDGYPEPVRAKVEALTTRRNSCPESELEAIDAEILTLLRPWTKLAYHGGCGSLFSVQSSAGRTWLRRERFY